MKFLVFLGELPQHWFIGTGPPLGVGVLAVKWVFVGDS